MSRQNAVAGAVESFVDRLETIARGLTSLHASLATLLADEIDRTIHQRMLTRISELLAYTEATLAPSPALIEARDEIARRLAPIQNTLALKPNVDVETQRWMTRCLMESLTYVNTVIDRELDAIEGPPAQGSPSTTSTASTN